MIARPLLALAAAALLAGCSASPSRVVFPRHYALSGNAALPATAAPAAAHATLRVDAISAPEWLDGTGMHYRLAYRGDQVIATYVESDWVAPPPRMLESRVRQALAATGAWRLVVGPGDPVRTDFVLRLRLDRFGQVFTAPGRSDGILDATATLVGTGGDRGLAQRRFTIRAPAATPDAAGGAAALDAASAQFTTELSAWLRLVPRGEDSARDGPPAR